MFLIFPGVILEKNVGNYTANITLTTSIQTTASYIFTLSIVSISPQDPNKTNN